MPSLTAAKGLSAIECGLSSIRSAAGKKLSPVKRLRKLAALERGDIVVLVIYAVAIGLVSLAVPIGAQAMVNTIAFTALLQPLVVLASLVLIGLFVAGFLRTMQAGVVEVLQQRFFVRAMHEATERVVYADIAELDEQGSKLVHRFFEVAIVQKAAASLLIDGVSVALQGGVSLVLLAFYHPALLAFDVVLIASIAFTLVGLGRHGVSTAVAESKAKYAAAEWIDDVAKTTRLFKANRAESFAFARADDLTVAYVKARKRHFRVLFRQIVASYILQAFATAGLLGLGGWLVISGELTLGQLVAAELIVTGVLSGFAKFGKYLESYYDLAASVDKLGAIVDLRSERNDGAPWAPSGLGVSVNVEDVAFSYDSKRAGVSGVSFEASAGASLAILGPDASGKTTLAELLFGLRSASRGRIELDGVDTRSIALGDLRKTVAMVATAEVFQGTVTDNLTFGRCDMDATRISAVLHAVSLESEIAALDEAASTQLGTHGHRLTSSEAIRLSLARALMAEPRLLIIDGLLDSLANDSAFVLLDSIRSFYKGMTLIVLTRRDDIAKQVGPVIRLDQHEFTDRGGAQ